MDRDIEHINVNESLLEILKMSHDQAMNGQTYSMDYVEHFMNDKIYELSHRMDTCGAAEPFGGI
ncbi:MAG: hypothetical protein IJ618_07440 [Prevotella sp.]|nr:hypothetical protein [Prevotella sp.]